MTTQREKRRRKAERERYRQLKNIGEEWDRENPGACPECSGRPGEHDWKAEGGDEHAPWCQRWVDEQSYASLADEFNDIDVDMTLADFDQKVVDEAHDYANAHGLPWPPGVGDFDNYWESKQ